MVEWSSVDLKSFENNSFWIYNILSIDRTSVSTIGYILLSFLSSNINQKVNKMSNDDDVYLKNYYDVYLLILIFNVIDRVEQLVVGD